MSKKILLIESDGAFADQLSGALAARGLDPRTSADGPAGLEAARAERPDLIVLCVELPKMSGYAVCNKLKKDDELRSIPLLITSAEATPETFEQHRKLKTRAEDYLLKPFDPAALLQHIASLIELPPEPAATDGALAPGDGLELDALGAEVLEGPAGAPGGGARVMDDDDLKLLDQVFDELASSGAELAPPLPPPTPPLAAAPAVVEPRPAPATPEAGAELAALRERVTALTSELAQARQALQAATAEHAQALTRAEQELREAREAARAAGERVRTADERLVAAEQRLKRDDAIREKMRKALALALQLMEEPAGRGTPGEVLPRRE